MEEKLKKVYDENFELRNKIIIRYNIETALKIHKEFIAENENYLDNPKRKIIISHLRTFAIERQLYNSSFFPQSPYSAYYEEVNSFHYPVLYLETEDFVINLAKTPKYNRIPFNSKYRLKNARNNEEISGQINLFDKAENSDKKYAFIIYGVDKESNITHMGIMLPDSQLKSFYNYDNLLELPHAVKGIEINQTMDEESLVKFRKELSSEMSKII